MHSLKIFACTSYGPHTALTGGRLRRDNILSALAERGHVIDRLNLTARPGVSAALQSGHWSLTGHVLDRAKRADVTLLGDVFCLPMVPMLRQCPTPVLLDIVDSPYRLVGSAPQTTWRDRMVAAAQAAQLLPVMHLLLPMVDGVTYISKEDRECDAERVRRMPPAWVVPNGIHSALFDLPLARPPADGYIAWLADWTYPPNRESFAWFTDAVSPLLPDEVLRRVRLFGAGDPRVAGGGEGSSARVWRLVQHSGFVDPLSAVYEGARVVVAPVTRGAGVNNKVLEPLAAGRPVITTKIGSRGLNAEIKGHLRVTCTASELAAEIALVASAEPGLDDAAAARGAVSILSWDAAGAAMEEVLRRVVASRTAV